MVVYFRPGVSVNILCVKLNLRWTSGTDVSLTPASITGIKYSLVRCKVGAAFNNGLFSHLMFISSVIEFEGVSLNSL